MRSPAFLCGVSFGWASAEADGCMLAPTRLLVQALHLGHICLQLPDPLGPAGVGREEGDPVAATGLGHLLPQADAGKRLEGAARRYDTDYWVNMMPEAVRALEAYVGKLGPTEPGHRYTVSVCGDRLSFEKKADARLQWTASWPKAEFFIAPTHMNCDRALEGQVIATIERLGVPIGVVKDRRALVLPEITPAQ